MTIHIHTDKTISGDEKHQNLFITQITQELDHYKSHISDIEVHLSDQNGTKTGVNDILCLLEAKLESKTPVVVKNQADSIDSAMSGALDKLKSSIEHVLGRMQNHHQKIDQGE